MKRITFVVIVTLITAFLSGCANILNHATIGVKMNLWLYPPIRFEGPDYDELIYCGTRANVYSWQQVDYLDCEELAFVPLLIIDLPLEFAMDTITSPYDIYAWFYADELAAKKADPVQK